MPAQKPHHGRIENWFKYETPGYGLGYLICGRFLDHPQYALESSHTSYVVTHDAATGEIETRNSRYTLVGKAVR